MNGGSRRDKTKISARPHIRPAPRRRDPDAAYDAILAETARRLQTIESAYGRERTAAAGLVTELLAQPSERRSLLIRNCSRFHTWGLYSRLLEESRALAIQHPDLAASLAYLAIELAHHLDPTTYGTPAIEDLRARAWTYIGNAHRLRSDLAGAEEAFQKAAAHLRRGTREPIERALFLDLKASLLRAQRRFDSAKQVLRQTFDLFLSVGDRRRAGRALISMEIVHHYEGTEEEGIPLLYQALELIDPDQEPYLVLCVWHNLIDDLAEAGRAMEARGLLRKARALYRRFPDAWTRNRRNWVAGKIARGLGQSAAAEDLFLAARRGFLEEGIAYGTALVSLDLAALYEVQGRTAEVKRLAAETVPVFSSRQIHREAMMALTYWQRAVEAEQGGLELVASLAAYLRRARYDPSLRFTAPAP